MASGAVLAQLDFEASNEGVTMIELLIQHPVWASACTALLILLADYAYMLYLRSKMVSCPMI